MSEEELEKVKQRHRASENKAIVKANMEYLKGIFKHLEDKKGAMPSMGSGTSHMSMPAMASPVPAAIFVDTGSTPSPEAGSVDISL